MNRNGIVPEPEAAWRVATGPILASAVSATELVVVEALKGSRLEGFRYVQTDTWKSNLCTIAMRVSVIDSATGEAKRLFEATRETDEIYIGCVGQHVVLAVLGELHTFDRETGQASIVPLDILIERPPIAQADALYFLCDKPRRVARWRPDTGFVVGPVIHENLVVVRSWSAGRRGIVVRLGPSMFESGRPSAIAFVDPGTLESEIREVGDGSHVVFVDDFELLDEEVRFQTAPTVVLSRPPPRPVRDDQWTVIETRGIAGIGFSTLTCRQASNPEVVKRWKVGPEIRCLAWMSRPSVLLIAGLETLHNEVQYSVLGPTSPGLRVLAVDVGTPIAPLACFDYVAVSLVHLGGNAGLYNAWIANDRPKRDSHTTVRWIDGERPRGEVKHNVPLYRFDILDLERCRISSCELMHGKHFRTAHAFGDRVVVETGDGVVAYTIGALVDASDRRSELDRTSYLLLQGEAPAAFRSRFHGPRDELWAHDSRLPALSHRDDEDEDTRLGRLHLELTQIEHETRAWPDSTREIASQLSPAQDNDLSGDALATFTAWDRDLEAGICRAQRTDECRTKARLLLQGYIRDCSTKRENDGPSALQLVGSSRRDTFADTVAWCCEGSPSKPRDEQRADRYFGRSKFFALVAGGALALGLIPLVELGGTARLTVLALVGSLALLAVVHAVLAVVAVREDARATRESVTTLDLLRLKERWPNGPPPVLADPAGYYRFLGELRDLGLINEALRSPRQVAVARAWACQRDGLSVFLSYSSVRASLALELAEALRALGVRVTLDRWELLPEAHDWEVESWIAERVMQADTMLFLISDEARRSGWVHREQAWSFRMLAVKPVAATPFLVDIDRDPEEEAGTRRFGPEHFVSVGTTGIAEKIARQLARDRLATLRRSI